ncbi:hypothetical protein F1559_001433 [Cyanidiococcus yangmingshanensis]|uniref:Uncharacterized protein n=1 Tax=Cyanidiococcus yangmingshanensis TaxID=2690220 RepID=A0A7J7IQ51_9RHOD|nr:hypothetical protein F1559_001433 [Cyanidiococcus yangmingshanensis]
MSSDDYAAHAAWTGVHPGVTARPPRMRPASPAAVQAVSEITERVVRYLKQLGAFKAYMLQFVPSSSYAGQRFNQVDLLSANDLAQAVFGTSTTGTSSAPCGARYRDGADVNARARFT